MDKKKPDEEITNPNITTTPAKDKPDTNMPTPNPNAPQPAKQDN